MQTRLLCAKAAPGIFDATDGNVRPHFNEREVSDLTLAVATINAWNHLPIAARLVPGACQRARVVT